MRDIKSSGWYGWGAALALPLGWLVTACADAPPPPTDPGEHVVLITLDGVRVRDVFGGADRALSGADEGATFPHLLAAVADEGVIYGDPRRFERMTTANRAQVSVPGYMSMFSGFEQPCYDNQCPPVMIETVFEYVRRARDLDPADVAVFASWIKMGRVVEHVVGTVTTDIGPDPDDTPAELPPWGQDGSARWDDVTYARAMDYLETHRPRLLYVSLLDGDGWGHEGDYASYLATLRRYDRWIAEVKERLAALAAEGVATTLIVTTDHGRGEGADWREHNATLPGSEQVFLHASGPHVIAGAVDSSVGHTAADLRPTIEVLFGLPPSTCDRCGSPFIEVVGGGS
jgi:hypothetical protein